MNGSRLPHSLRLVIFFLRLALGLNFFYLGWSTLFNQPLGRELGSRSLGDLYAWVGPSLGTTPLHTSFAWAFLAIGALLFVGLITRFSSFIAIILTLMSYAPSVTISPINFAQFANDAVLVTAALLVLIFGDAGGYLGLDRFVHFRLKKRRRKE